MLTHTALARGRPATRTPIWGRLWAPWALLSLAYLGVGLWLFWSAGQGDLRLRWLEKMYVLSGIDPLGPGAAGAAAAAGLPPLGELAGYAPWSYVYALLFAPGSDAGAAAAWFLVLNLLAFGYLASFGYRYGKRFDGSREFALCTAAGAVAFLAVPMVLRHANYGLLVAALLAGMVETLGGRRQVLGGVCLGLAMVKPQLAALFFCLPLVRGRWVTLGSAAALVLIAWLAAATLAQAPPLRMLLEMLHQGTGYSDAYQGVFSGLSLLGAPAGVSTAIGLAIGGAVSLALCWRFRAADPVLLAAIPAVLATAWSYHRTHDLMVLTFLGLAALAAAVRAKPGRPLLWWSLLATPWLPVFNRMTVGYTLPTAIRILWLMALGAVLAVELQRTGRGAGMEA